MSINLIITESASFLEGLVPVSFSTTGLNAHNISIEDNTYTISAFLTLLIVVRELCMNIARGLGGISSAFSQDLNKKTNRKMLSLDWVICICLRACGE